MLAEVGPDVLHLESVARFPNDPVQAPDGLHWDFAALRSQVVAGLCAAGERAPDLTSIGIDTWAVDYGLLRAGRLLAAPFHYRDEGRRRGVDEVHRVVPHHELFPRNGLQFLPFSTLYQLAADPLVEAADHLLLVPDLLAWSLTGTSVSERTVASTTGLLDVHTREWDDVLIATLGLPRRVLADLVDPGTTIGTLLPEVVSATALESVPVVAVGSHDTASAVVGTPLEGDAAYVSCGTWGLAGVELEQPVLSDAARAANFTNEAGVDGTVRFHTNVMGLWLLSECLRQWRSVGLPSSLADLLVASEELPGRVHTFDVQDPVFLAPGDMPARVVRWYDDAGLPAPTSQAAIVRAIVHSLAQGFAEAVDRASRLARRTVTHVNLVGGGALNATLCQSLADRSGLEVQAGPVEATAMGNALVQARSAGALHGDLQVLRDLVRRCHPARVFTPRGRPDVTASA